MRWGCAAVFGEALQVVGDATLVHEGVHLAADAVVEHDAEAAVEEGADLEVLADGVGIEGLVAEDLGIGGEPDGGAPAPVGPEAGEAPPWAPCTEGLM
ncbi:MAG: hypothetical protein ACK559_30155, partial [bacterium]